MVSVGRGEVAAGLGRFDQPLQACLPETQRTNPLHLIRSTLHEARLLPAQGGTRVLSARTKDGSDSGAAHKASHAKSPDEKKGRKQRAGDIGRALRTIYDDTLRESVPDDFNDLLGKLT